MSAKIVGIAAGEGHTLALTEDGRVYSWGRGNFGRLGTGKEDSELFPVPVVFFDASFSEGKEGSDPGASSEFGNRLLPKFVQVAAGSYHSVALAEDGSVWSWGYNLFRQLGHIGDDNSSIPCLVERFQKLGFINSSEQESKPDHKNSSSKVCSVGAGGMMSAAIDSLGSLWMWGNLPTKTEEVAFSFISCPPMPVRDFHGHTVVKVACGNEHVVALVSAGQVPKGDDLMCYSWGNNNYGQLGLGDTTSRTNPEIIKLFQNENLHLAEIFEISCGAFHTAILTRGKLHDQYANYSCWTFGLGEYGQLGHGTSRNTWLPEPVEGLPAGAPLISVDCGSFHTSVVTAAGDVWCWGSTKGRGLCPDAGFGGPDSSDALSPIVVYHVEDPVQVACGAAHTVLVASGGYKLWAWGRGLAGLLGHGQTTYSFSPCPVLWPPPGEDFKKEGIESGEAKAGNQEVGRTMETDQKLSVTEREVEFLKNKLTMMERYASLLHISIFRKPMDERNLPQSIQVSGVFNIGKELDNLLDSADNEELARMEMFYNNMLSCVKDKLLKRRIQEIVKETLSSLSTGRQSC